MDGWLSGTRETWLSSSILLTFSSWWFGEHLVLKGKLGDFFYWLQTKTSFKMQFSTKRPKVGQKSGQRVQNSQNKDQMASDLLWESTFFKFGHQPTVGIHQFCPRSYCGNPLYIQHTFSPTMSNAFMIQVEHLQHKKWPERESDSMGCFSIKAKKFSFKT